MRHETSLLTPSKVVSSPSTACRKRSLPSPPRWLSLIMTPYLVVQMTPSQTAHGCGSIAPSMVRALANLIIFSGPHSHEGFYQRGDPSNPLSIETAFLSLDLFQNQCNEAFPDGLPPSPAVDHINKYGDWNMTPSNILFTNGECA